MFQLLAPPSLQNDKCFSFLQNLDMPHDIPHIYIYVISKNKISSFLQNTICNLDMQHDIPHIYICVSVKLIEFDMQHDIPHIYMCF